MRTVTFHIVRASGAKLKGGGEIKITDLWKLPSDVEEAPEPSWAETSKELKRSILSKFLKRK